MKTEQSSPVKQTVLLGLTIAVLPVMFYPHKLGLSDLRFEPLYVLAEWALYTVLFLFLLPRVRMMQRVIAGGGTLIVRMAIGGIFAFSMSLTNPVDLTDAATQALWEYTPAILIHIVFTPFVMRAWWMSTFGVKTGKRAVVGFTKPGVAAQQQATPVQASTPTVVRQGVSFGQSSPPPAAPMIDSGALNFQSAVDYIGDYHDVRLCWLTDPDGLVVAAWQRQQYSGDSDFWGALTLEMARYHQRILSIGEPVAPSRVEVRTNGGKLILEAIDQFWLGVLTGPDSDELLNVRLAQAGEMIVRHLNDRYSKTKSGAREAAYA